MATKLTPAERTQRDKRRRTARALVLAKVRYWDLLRAFELETTSEEEGEWPDRINDDVISRIDDFAIADADQINTDMLDDLIEVALRRIKP